MRSLGKGLAGGRSGIGGKGSVGYGGECDSGSFLLVSGMVPDSQGARPGCLSPAILVSNSPDSKIGMTI